MKITDTAISITIVCANVVTTDGVSVSAATITNDHVKPNSEFTIRVLGVSCVYKLF